MSSRVVIILLLGILTATAARGQQDTKTSGQTPVLQAQATATAENATAPKPGLFYEKDLDLHFNYPVEMRTLDAASDMELGHRNIFGMPGDTDPEHREAIRCTRFVLDVDLPKENAPQRDADIGELWVDDSKEYKESRKAEPIFAKIVIVEFLRDCVPKKLRKKENDVLGSMALSAVSMPGIQRIPQPIWYETANQKIHMNCGVGRPIINGQLASAPIIVMSMATQWRDHLLEWVITSNDAQIFNVLTKSVVQFGNGPWGPMFAPNLGPRGSGTPITVLPK